MDPVTTAILAAVAAGATKVGERALSDAYSFLKDAISRRFERDTRLQRAVQAVEADPQSAARREALEQTVRAVRADRDFAVYEAARAVLDVIESRSDGSRLIQQVVNGNNNIFVGKGNVGSGSSYYETYYGGDTYHGVDPDSKLPQTAVGWIFGIIAIVCILAGLGIFGYTVLTFNPLTAFEDQSTLDEGFPPGIVQGAGLFFTGFVIGIIGNLIDRGLGSRRKR